MNKLYIGVLIAITIAVGSLIISATIRLLLDMLYYMLTQPLQALGVLVIIASIGGFFLHLKERRS